MGSGLFFLALPSALPLGQPLACPHDVSSTYRPTSPHYRASEFTFPPGALATLDRNLLGGCGSIMGWIGAQATHGISETHVLHHVSSKIPHYNAWEASNALYKRLGQAGIKLEGAPGGRGGSLQGFQGMQELFDVLTASKREDFNWQHVVLVRCVL
ncbi:uncharacterized protein F5147DRAFT_378095 [Suillus discolor]|uniref:Uncharacterized protein n=1 Tax=Suillus discolor TaxID=1912936 RepID=A0A9P7JPR0_9AGAM|nr:uncharacterized protein F5147DRAFT_378095 [Suillus discolor]KAG2096527.1 hypothetical protein F5147DRAFT_378095 [Suillus discolor]